MGSGSSQVINFEHLFHGRFVQKGQVIGEPQLIAYSPGVAMGQWKECINMAPLKPMGSEQALSEDDDAIGLFRGHAVNYILAHARRIRPKDSETTIVTVHYVILSQSAVDAMAGNLGLVSLLLKLDMPTFPNLESELSTLPMPAPKPPTVKQQMNALTTVLTQCRSDASTVRGLLAAGVHEQPLAIVNCDASVKARLSFIQGLLSLLPPPARPRFTFSTHISAGESSAATIKFLAPDVAPPRDHQVFNWQEGELMTEPPAREPYSGFAVGQMQLDPVGLARRLNSLAATARHHMQAAPLSEAMPLVSRRAVMDIALAESQPLDRDDVIELLQDDPTLTGALRRDYAAYLLRVTLALDELEPADALIPLVQEEPNMAKALFGQLQRAAREGQAAVAYRLLKRWLDLAPALANAWPHIFGEMALAYHGELVADGATAPVAAHLETLENAPTLLDLEPVMGKILAASHPLACKNSRIARATLRLAAHHLPPQAFDALLSDAEFVNQLPSPVHAAIAALDRQKPLEGSGRGVLIRAHKAIGDGGEVVLARFAELAVSIQRFQLIDVPALEALRKLASTEYAERFSKILKLVVWAIAQSDTLKTLPEPGPLLMAQILLLLNLPEDLAKLLLIYQVQLFGPGTRDDFRQLVRALFQVTPVAVDQTVAAMEALEKHRDFDQHALALAYRSVLHVHDWSPGVEHASNSLLKLVDARPELAVTLGFPFTVELFRYVAERGDQAALIQVAMPLFAYLPEDSAQAAPILRRVWPQLAEDEQTRETAIDLLRGYARRIPEDAAVQLLRTFSGKRAEREREALQATVVLRPIFGQRDMFTFTEQVEEAASLFEDLVIAFEYNPPPGPKLLAKELESMSGALSKAEQSTLARQTRAIAEAIVEFGRGFARDHPQEALLKRESVPKSAAGFMHWLSGFFGEGEADGRAIDRQAMAHPFGTRSLPMLCREVDATAELLKSFLEAFSVKKPPDLEADALSSELESLWVEVQFDRKKIRATLARDCQTLALLVMQTAKTGGSTSFLGADASRQIMEGKAPPQSVIDCLRWLSGYFAGKHSQR